MGRPAYPTPLDVANAELQDLRAINAAYANMHVRLAARNTQLERALAMARQDLYEHGCEYQHVTRLETLDAIEMALHGAIERVI